MKFDLDDAIKTALKEKDKAALAGYRSLKAKVMNKLTEPGRGVGKPLNDEEMLGLAKKEVRERMEANEYLDESREEYQENARIIQVLEKLLPAQLGGEALESAVRKAIEESGASGMQDLGKVMAALRQVAGVDMGAASKLVKEILAGQQGAT
ncbi:MAG: GatB/YqeY domain-containing protein [Deltaproteobacteria bacterium]|nr:GatB/YqeY domain-containing protein [Deltaproteobacteria bacterium]